MVANLRTLVFLSCGAAAAIVWSVPAHAQAGDTERAAARDLATQGAELQRAGNFAGALDKLQRAQQVFSAPTNLLHIAECQAALGRLVESAESYRAVLRSPLPAGSPPAFHAAVAQARSELAQVEPRVSKLTVQVKPSGLDKEEMQIDGHDMPAALIGEPMPLDPGTHTIVVLAPGYASTEQQVTLVERESKSLSVTLPPIAGNGAAAPAPAQSAAPAPTTPPPAPPSEGTIGQPADKGARTALLVGAHLGMDLPSGQVPTPMSSTGNAAVNFGDVSGAGIAAGLDAGLRFERQWYLGAIFEYAGFGQGSNLSTGIGTGASKETSQTMQLAAVLGLIVNPDRVSFLGEVGVAYRWYEYAWTDSANIAQKDQFNSAELLLGAGIWIPVGRSLRIVPEATLNLGNFSSDGTSASATTSGHAFIMLGVGGFFDVGL